MKLVFTGDRTLRKGKVFAGYTGPLDKLFKGGFRIPLKGIEIPVQFTQRDSPRDSYLIDGTCSKVSVPEERVHAGSQEKSLVVRCDDVKSIEISGFQGCYEFGIDILAEYVRRRMEEAVSDSPEKASLLEKAGVDDRNVKRLLFDYDQHRLSRNHFVLFKDEDSYSIADPGSLLGTWVRGNKIGPEFISWPFWDVFEQSKKHGFPYSRFTMVDSDNEIFCLARFLEAEESLRRIVNAGHVDLNVGSEITLGKEAFRHDYKFVLKE